MRFFWQKKPEPKVQVEPPARSGFFTTDWELPPRNAVAERERLARALKLSFQRGVESFRPVDAQGKTVSLAPGHAMDEAYPDLTQAKLINSSSGVLPTAQLAWYGQQGFIGWQMAAILAQNWLIDKACTIPAQDAIRHGWEISITDGTELKPEILDQIKRADKKFQIKRQCREFVKNGRIFGIRHALFLVDGIDYAAPFNPDGVRPGSYKGITQIDPYWISPILDTRAASNPAAKDFYEPTWWLVNGQKVHRSHFVIMRNGDTVPDILKPSYFYGGIPVPQKIFERVFASEKTANEAPMLAMTKRLTALKMDLTEAAANPEALCDRMRFWTELQNNFGVKVVGEGDTIEQFDTSLSDLDDVIMTQYQLVAAAANIPATKLLGTTPKGFSATGEYDESSYHEDLESIQEHDLTPFVDAHHIRLIRSEIAPRNNIKPFGTEIAWKAVDSPTAKELAEINKAKADTDNILVAAGGIDGYDVRQRLINDPDSGYTALSDIVPGGPGDREAQQEAEGQLEMPVNARVSAKTEAEPGAQGAKAAGEDEAIYAGVMYVAGGKILLLKYRDSEKYERAENVGQWGFPAGKIEAGETAMQAACREFEEETGKPLQRVSPAWDDGRFSMFMAYGDEFVPKLTTEHGAYLWVEPKEFPEPIHPDIREQIEAVLMASIPAA